MGSQLSKLQKVPRNISQGTQSINKPLIRPDLNYVLDYDLLLECATVGTVSKSHITQL